MYCQAIHPDGRRFTFDDVLEPGQVVGDEDSGEHFVVGPDLGDQDPRLMAMDHDHYLAWWRTQANPLAVLCATTSPEQAGA